MTLGEFLDKYPEFDTGDSTELVDGFLTEVTGRLQRHQTVFGAYFDEAIGALTAHRLWSSPYGVTLRGDSDSPDSSKYKDHYDALWAAVRSTARVTSRKARGWSDDC